MNIFIDFLQNIWTLASAMSFYILFGLLLAGVIKQFIADDFISRHLGKSSTASVLKATILGIPMPVCSCSVIPLAKSLQKEGASKGAVQSFMISTPITGVDSIMATYSFFGWFFTIYRVITSIVIAIITGLLQNFFDNKDNRVNNISFTDNPTCCNSSCCSTQNSSQSSNKFSLKGAFRYAYVTLFEDIYLSLLIGIVLGAMFTTFLPKEIIEPLFENQFITYIAVMIIAMPLYVCATASLPIAGAFLLSGMSAGGAFVFLSAGPATNSVTMGVVASMFGKRGLFVYLGTIATLSVLFGYIFDTLFGSVDILATITSDEHSSVLDIVSTTLMFGLIFYYIIKRKN
jgi:uncharacterized membrane protein YraQ (UPF0718 family)